jgi:hypothetical protein
MFIPPNYRYDDEPMKTILLFNGLSNWMVEDGQNVFISKQCPVNRCTITSKKSEASNVDAILFRDHFSHPGHRKTGKQVRSTIYYTLKPTTTKINCAYIRRAVNCNNYWLILYVLHHVINLLRFPINGSNYLHNIVVTFIIHFE